jgi:hypothetical protein
LDLKDGVALKPVKCPFADQALSGKIKGKDWTTYQGYHHTDHSIRNEFFDGREQPDRSRGQYLLDFSYIAGGADGENRELMDGIIVDKAYMDCDIGPAAEWRFMKPPEKAPLGPKGEEETPIQAESGDRPRLDRPPEEDAKITSALNECRKWLEAEIVL